MIGVVIFCHGDMAAGMRHAAEMVIGPQEQLALVDVRPGCGLEDARRSLSSAISRVDTGDGVLVLTDLPGGTPANTTAMLLGERLEMIAGFNLPALIKVLMARPQAASPRALARIGLEHGLQHATTGDLMLGGAGRGREER